MISPWQLDRQSVEIHSKIDWTSIGEGTPKRLDYKAPYDLGMRSPAYQEEVIYEIASQA